MIKALDAGHVVDHHPDPERGRRPLGGFTCGDDGEDLSMDGFEDSTRTKHVMANIES
ncbi:MAG: hypothetical protein L0H96_01420 [Humibacillus sp.]|nr:hypothetical protein [Humibacillus sp.]MDN5775554.1 hypothetical protein [Humibacillus sp.]